MNQQEESPLVAFRRLVEKYKEKHLTSEEHKKEFLEIFRQLDEIRTEETIEIEDIITEKKPKFNPTPNRYTSIRKITELLDVMEYPAEEIELLWVLMNEIVHRSNGSLKGVLQCLYSHSKKWQSTQT